MTIEIKKQEEAPLFNRTNIEARTAFDGPTPTRKDIQKQLSTKLKVEKELIIVHSIYTEFGHGVADIKASTYKNKKDLEAVERKYMINRHAEKKTEGGDAPEETAAPAEAKPEGEAPVAEEKTPEAPAEAAVEEKAKAPAEEKKEE